MKNSISATYNGEKILVETNDNSINLTRGQAYNLIKLLQDIDNKYNLKGRIIKEEEWDRINSIKKRCLNLKSRETLSFNVNDRDFRLALLNQLDHESTLVVTTRDDIVTITKTPF